MLRNRARRLRVIRDTIINKKFFIVSNNVQDTKPWPSWASKTFVLGEHLNYGEACGARKLTIVGLYLKLDLIINTNNSATAGLLRFSYIHFIRHTNRSGFVQRIKDTLVNERVRNISLNSIQVHYTVYINMLMNHFLIRDLVFFLP